MVASAVLVGMAEIHVAKGAATFTCLGLGSCIGLVALDPTANVSGSAHIMLPEAFGENIDKPGKFANTAIPELLRMLEGLGAQRSRLRWAMAGGAQVFKFGGGANSRLDVGARNSAAVDQIAKQLGMRMVARDVGGSLGRTVTFTAETGIVLVRTVSQGEVELCRLRG